MNTDMSVLKEVDWGAILPLIIPVLALHLLLLVVALVDLYRRRGMVNRPIIWLIVIVLLNTVGPISYLIIGRRMVKNDRRSSCK
ncbi:PLDc_N domain-containing protein [Virgibacillus sp. NKC19-3]|uniref:PLDc N-terminal domain-containing protein n=1 Tax=Virgibacillus saliphilus TaxID=2831674 RepID=UPI001C9A72BD|nr:PLDc N-terminal domain-containing protein [Virgibacillus sp. NKC19-3]MBY7145078.1 PLDc_N domain-containing protein [Virgibacillus sp. NKC19-3]